MNGQIKLDEIVYSKGNRTDGFIRYGQKPDCSHYAIPVIIVRGDRDGPVLLVDACTHGDEYEGAIAITRMAKTLETKSFSGTFVGVPALNFEAFSVISRASVTDGFNLNRIFPGNYDTYITHRLAATYIDRVVRSVDYCITFHGGGDVLHLEPIIGYLPPVDAMGKTSHEMAKAFNGKYNWRMSNLPFTGVSIMSYKEICGVVGILPEVGSHCGRLYDQEKNVGICYDGIGNVMSYLKMTSDSPAKPGAQTNVELYYLHCKTGGFQELCKRENEIVKEGETLGVIRDVFGNVIEELKAPYDGVVIGFWSVPVIRPGDWWYLFAKILDDKR
jgi:predicted deacylase